MNGSQHRKKQPEIVRQRLLDATAGIAAAQGLHAVTIQSVSTAAGVTKGGLFHHFANKDDLIHEVIRQQLAQVDVVVDEALVHDSGHGCFTRAYVLAIFAMGATTAPVSLALFTEPGLNEAWAAWLAARLERHAATDSGVALAAVRMAADGVWLADLWPAAYSIGDRDALRQHLLDLTRKEPA
ncbi:TetR/AcrR family transcriptional regulator [Paracoccus sp. DMF-8]|uniref:TetR/AcrR family transcriptional regulator n=1 Tax=Paracoccus sp. DMF-8 TaxID=3019445 RepID=UPI0023E7A240|nr:TetR/AcrR family transcriptional regulator [Paracoccus sp. DMF-8]MDF3604974.1 TetR/AcrR family transcriptional regulator [Paracoccus sp. DMF-8]